MEDWVPYEIAPTHNWDACRHFDGIRMLRRARATPAEHHYHLGRRLGLRGTTPTRHGTTRRRNAIRTGNKTKLATSTARYKEILEDMDKSLGTILDTVNELELAQNTLIFFWSDNGDVGMGPAEMPFRGSKFSQYEGGHRVPAVAWWPGKIKAGVKSAAFLAGFDLFPTLTDIAGISKDNPTNLDGTSAKDLFLQQKEFPNRDLFFGYEPKLGTGMRHGDWKMILKGDDVQGYNLKNDLKETTNVATENREITASMRQAIEHFKQSVVPDS